MSIITDSTPLEEPKILIPAMFLHCTNYWPLLKKRTKCVKNTKPEIMDMVMPNRHFLN